MKPAIIAIVLLFLIHSNTIAQDKPVALVGATIVDVTGYGNNTHDITNAIVILQHGKIIATGKRGDVKIPKTSKVIDVHGKYIIPGLIDCFSVIGTQGQANSHLYYGVTTMYFFINQKSI